MSIHFKYSGKPDGFIVGLGCLTMLFNLGIFITYIIGLIHAFSASLILGVISIFLPPVTVIIQIVDWFSSRNLWGELGTFVDNLLV